MNFPPITVNNLGIQISSSGSLIWNAPRFPGRQIRDKYIESSGVPAFVDIIQDPNGKTKKLCKTLCKSLGFSKGGIIYISYKMEAEIDLYIEQFMAPLFFAAVENSFSYLVVAVMVYYFLHALLFQ